MPVNSSYNAYEAQLSELWRMWLDNLKQDIRFEIAHTQFNFLL